MAKRKKISKKISLKPITTSIDHVQRELKNLRPKVIEADKEKIDLQICALKLCGQIVESHCFCACPTGTPTHPAHECGFTLKG